MGGDYSAVKELCNGRVIASLLQTFYNGMVHGSQESIFTNFDWGQGTWDAYDLQSLVPSPKSEIVKIV